MLSRFGHEQRESTTRIAVDVTFLKMSRPPQSLPPALSDGLRIVQVDSPSVAFYLRLYAAVGANYCWWLRRVAPEPELAELLADPDISLHVLYDGEGPCGFFELDARNRRDVNIAYFGLLPHMIGKGLGSAFLRKAIDAAWLRQPATIRVNTCTADHPRALETYLRAGFRPQRTVREIWDIPDRLGLCVPSHLRI